MWLVQRSTSVRHRAGHQLIALGICLAPAIASAQTANQAATVGPSRIICNATFCELAAGTPGKSRVRVIVAALPKEDTGRLRKCTGVAPACIVTINGTTEDNSSRIVATEIYWQN